MQKKSNFENFESALYSTSGSMPLIHPNFSKTSGYVVVVFFFFFLDKSTYHYHSSLNIKLRPYTNNKP